MSGVFRAAVESGKGKSCGQRRPRQLCGRDLEREREGVAGCGGYLRLRMGSLGGGGGPGGQVLPPSTLENQGQGIAQASDPLPSELAPPNP